MEAKLHHPEKFDNVLKASVSMQLHSILHTCLAESVCPPSCGPMHFSNPRLLVSPDWPSASHQQRSGVRKMHEIGAARKMLASHRCACHTSSPKLIEKSHDTSP
jgi:hypothetical protein